MKILSITLAALSLVVFLSGCHHDDSAAAGAAPGVGALAVNNTLSYCNREFMQAYAAARLAVEDFGYQWANRYSERRARACARFEELAPYQCVTRRGVIVDGTIVANRCADRYSANSQDSQW